MRAGLLAGISQGHGGPFAVTEPRGDIAVVVDADTDDRRGPDYLAAVVLGHPHVRRLHAPHLPGSYGIVSAPAAMSPGAATRQEAGFSRGSVLPSPRRWSSMTEATCRTHTSNASGSSEYIPRSLRMNVTICRTVCSGRLSTLMNLPPPASAKPGIAPGLIP